MEVIRTHSTKLFILIWTRSHITNATTNLNTTPKVNLPKQLKVKLIKMEGKKWTSMKKWLFHFNTHLFRMERAT
jgi:hypothetical protein